MKRLALLSLLLATPALAQQLPSPQFQTVGATNGYLFAPGLNALSQSNTSLNSKSIAIGPWANASAPAGQRFMFSAGPGAAESLTSPTPEAVAIGHFPAATCITCEGFTAIGTSTGAGQTNSNGFIAIGGDAQRDYADVAGASLTLGTQSQVDGQGIANTVIGNGSAFGSTSTITLGGAITAGDVLTFTFSTTNGCNVGSVTVNCVSGLSTPLAISYTVTSADVSGGLNTLASHVVAAINSPAAVTYIYGDGAASPDRNTFALGFQINDATNHPTVISGHYPYIWAIGIAHSCTGTCGETVTVGGGSNFINNIFVGGNIANNPLIATMQGNAIVTPANGPGANFTGQYDTIIGYGAAQGAKTEKIGRAHV